MRGESANKNNEDYNKQKNILQSNEIENLLLDKS